MRLWWWAKRTSRERKRERQSLEGRTTLTWLLETSPNGELSRVTSLQNSRFSWLIPAGDVSRGGTSTTRRQRFHANDVNQCLHNKPFSSCFSPRTIRNGRKRYPLAPRKESPPPMCSTLYIQLLLLTLGPRVSTYTYVRTYVRMSGSLFKELFIWYMNDLHSGMSFVPEWSCGAFTYDKTKRVNQRRSL